VSRVADFGVARTDAPQTTEQKYLIGKLCFLPREHLCHEELWPNADVYSLAVSLWVAILGHEPWPESDEAQLLRHTLTDRLPLLSSERQVSPAIDALIAQGTEPDRTQRFQSARAMADAIENAMAAGERVASAREVADFVEQLAGPELSARSNRVAAWFAQRDKEPTRAPMDETRFSQEVTAMRPREGRSLLLRSAVAALMLLAAAAAFAAYSMREQRTAAALPQSPAPAPASSEVPRLPEVAPGTAPEPVASTITPPASAAASAVVPKFRVPAPNAQAERVPTKITTKNPYRD